MDIHNQHPWPASIENAREIQNKLRCSVILKSGIPLQSIQTIAAADVTCSKKNKRLFAAVVLFSFPEIQFLSVSAIQYPEIFPYIPGYLSFRELPPLISIFETLNEKFEVILCAAHGFAHHAHQYVNKIRIASQN
jgi:deoxyribonuclease V